MSDKKSLNEAILEAMESEIEMSNNQSYNDALEWAASWITGAQMLGRSEEVVNFAKTMAMSIRAAKRGLTQRAPDAANVCRVVEHVYVDGTCAECGYSEPQRR